MNTKNFLLLAAMIATGGKAMAGTMLKELKVEHDKTPLAVSSLTPRFAWQMVADDNKRGWKQKAYHIIVKDEQGNKVWDSGKIDSDKSINIQYAGKPLTPTTRYTWTLNVWNQKDEEMTATSHFETALTMTGNYNHTLTFNDEKKAWDGAKWIGVGNDATMFYSPYFPVFSLNYDVALDKKSASTKAAFLFGANDPRLMDDNKNLLGVCNKQDSSYIKVELDIEPIRKGQEARLNVYRRGYKKNEDGNTPIASFSIPQSVINKDNMYQTQHFCIDVNASFAVFYISTDSQQPTRIGDCILSPTGKRGGDYIAYPVLADIGYAMNTGQKASFSNIEVHSLRSPKALITTLQKEPLVVDGGKNGSLMVKSPKTNGAPMLRTSFTTTDKKIVKARLYATARGIYDIYINGKRVSDAYFNPGVTQYNRSQLYQTFDVTPFIAQGDNAIGAILGEGWWSGGATFITDNWNFFGDRQSLLAKLVITYDDGSSQSIVTDPKTWKAFNDGPTRYGSFFQGEVYDAEKEKTVNGWASPNFNDTEWQHAAEIVNEGFNTSADFQLLADMAAPIMPIDTLCAESMEETRKGVYVYDLGQNMAGVPLIRLNGMKPGTKIKLRFAEIKYPDLPKYKEHTGMIMTENLRTAMCQDIYICKGGEEVYTPRFTSHGFRYIEITGIDAPLSKEDVGAIAISSLHHLASRFESSDTGVNKIWQNTVWSARSNFMSVPTDCPQRNERLGWMGDISVFGRSATYLTDASQFLRRYLISVRDTQADNGRFPDVAPTGCGFGGLLWGSAGITVPWELYQQYDDTVMLAEHYDAMKTYIQYVLNDCIDKKSNIIVQYRQWGDLGDWLSLEDERNDKSLIWECYFIFDLDIMSRMATALGKVDDAQHFAELAAQRREFFKKTYVNPTDGKTIFSAFDEKREGAEVNTQTSYALPLAFNVVDGELRHKMSTQFAESVKHGNDKYPEYSLLTGFIGTAWINNALSDNGMTDIAYRLLLQDDFPSWLYPIRNGATTIWERLNSFTLKDGFGKNNSMNSFNHYSFGAVVSWLYSHSLGIQRDTDSPAFKHFILKPETDSNMRITNAKGYYDSMYGRIESAWQSNATETVYDFTVPANTTATLFLPAMKKGDIREDGKTISKKNGIEYISKDGGLHRMELLSGSYHFTVKK